LKKRPGSAPVLYLGSNSSLLLLFARLVGRLRGIALGLLLRRGWGGGLLRLGCRNRKLWSWRNPFALHFLFQDAERLVDVVVADKDLQRISLFGLDQGS